jgi:hypothetical protein
MKAIKRVAIVLGAYLGIVVAFESLVGFMGASHADRGVQPDEDWVLLTTKTADGSTNDTVVAGVESGGHLYVAANHWPRAWYDEAVESPEVELTRRGERIAYRAVPVSGAERERIAGEYRLPWAIRLLTGFPPRAFLRLDPR